MFIICHPYFIGAAIHWAKDHHTNQSTHKIVPGFLEGFPTLTSNLFHDQEFITVLFSVKPSPIEVSG
jgi:hypothetical protein